MAFRDYSKNEKGTPIALMTCDVCGSDFSVTPVPENLDNWHNCMTPECGSYDESRDADLLFGDTEGRDKANKLRGKDGITDLELYQKRKATKVVMK